MAQPISMTFKLTGPHAGKTIKLGNNGAYPFVRGLLTIRSNAEGIAGATRVLARFYQAHPVGSAALKHAEAVHEQGAGDGERNPDGNLEPNGDPPVDPEVQPDGGGASPVPENNGGRSGGPEAGDAGDAADGDGQPDPGLPESEQMFERIRSAISSLSVTNGSHWTQDGLPAVAAVASLPGLAGVNRSEISAAAPGYTLAMAKAGDPIPPVGSAGE